LIEFALVAVMLMVMLFAIIDFSRIILIHQVMINVSREGGNLISRGTDMTNAINALIVSAQPLDINTHGCIILSAVFNNSGTCTISAQQKTGGIVATSKVGPLGATGGAVHLPNPQLPQTNQTLWVSEVFYSFTPVTPVGKLLGITLPRTNYDAAYF